MVFLEGLAPGVDVCQTQRQWGLNQSARGYYPFGMSNLLKNILDGMGQIWVLIPQRRPYPPTRGGFARDAYKLRGDFAAVGRDLRRTLKRDQQAYERARK